MFNFRTCCLKVVAAALAAIPFAVHAQPAGQQPAVPRGGLNPDSFYGKESFQGVSVRDSLEAIKKLEDARRMERLEDWNKAADWYQEVIEKFGDRVVPSATDKDKNISQYTGIERPVQEQLAKWPKAGLDAYRNRYGSVAATMLEQARRDDISTLSRVMRLYFVTDAGKAAGIRLVDLLLENGDFLDAARVGDRLLDWHPDLVVERPKVLFRTALAYHLSGDAKKAKEKFDQLQTKHAGAVGTVFGKDIVLAEALAQLQQVAPPVSVASASGSYRFNPGGNESRSQVPGDTGKAGARMASIELSPPPVRNIPVQQQRELEASARRDSDSSGGNLGILPVVDDGEMYFQDSSRIYAVSLQSGVPLPGWFQSYPNTNGQYTVNSWGATRNQQHTLTLTETQVLAVMGHSERAAQYGVPVYGQDRGTRLVCLDRATGRERWVARPNKITEENLRTLDFSGSPLVVGDNVYIMGRGGKNMSAEDCYVLCFDMNSGSYKWGCFVASSNNGWAYAGQAMTADTLSHLAYSSGRVYALTNVGACAALDAYSGTISWLNIYPRTADSNTNPEAMMMGGWRGMRGQGASTARSWEFNPVIVQEGKVFILPTDGKFLMVYDAGTGTEIKRIPTTDLPGMAQDRSNSTRDITPQGLLGVDGNQVVLSGGKRVYCLDWTKDWAKNPEDAIEWISENPKNVRGRGFVTADSVFFCTESNLNRIDRKTGKIVDMYPARGRNWDEGEGPGNVLVNGDQVIVSGTKRVNVYADMKLARQKLDDDVAAAPADPEPRLRYAEVMFVAGQLPVAMEKLDETIKLLGGLKSMRPGPERDHLFNDCITFATKLQREKKAENIEETLAAIDRLYDLAASAADGDSQQVNYRISRAKFNRDFKQEGSLENAVRLYQEILVNAKLRNVPLVDDEAGTTQAAIVAEKLIGEVKKNSPRSYEKYEKEAGDALLAAGKDPAALKQVADFYPNSKSAADAMIKAAVAFEEGGNNRLAAHTLMQVYNKYGEGSDRAKLLEDMARNFLAMRDDRIDTAVARLATIVTKLQGGSNPLSKPLVLQGGKELAPAGMPINEALKAVQKFKSQAVAAHLPDFRIVPPPSDEQRALQLEAIHKWKLEGADPEKKPKFSRVPFVEGAEQLVISDIQALADTPRELRQQFSRLDRVVAWSNGNVVLFPVGSDKPLGQVNILAERPTGLAWLERGKSLLIWSNTEVALLDEGKVSKKWKLELRGLPRIEVIAGGAKEEQVTAANDQAGQDQIFLNGGQRMVLRRRIINGRVVQQMQPVIPLPAGQAGGVESIAHVRPVDDRVIIATTAGQIFSIKINDGSLGWHTRLAAASPIDRVVATDDFTVAKVTDSANTQLVVIDTLTGQLVRRMNFANDSGNVPVNLALAADGMLVWTQPDRLCGKDLFEPSRALNYEIVAGQNQGDTRAQGAIQMDGQPFNPIYAGAVQPDQLIISEGRVLAVAFNGKFVHIHSLETGKMLDYTQADGRRVAAMLSTSPGKQNQPQITDWSVSLNVVGPVLFVTSRQCAPMMYVLDHPNESWDGTVDPTTPPNFLYQDPLVGKDYFVLLGQPARKPAVADPQQKQPVVSTFRMHAYSRLSVGDNSGRESGRLDYTKDVRDEAGISEWLPVEGGFYYRTGDNKLHFLKGGRN